MVNGKATLYLPLLTGALFPGLGACTGTFVAARAWGLLIHLGNTMPGLHALSLLVVLVAAPATALAQTPEGPARGPTPSVVFAARAHGPLQVSLAEADTLRPMSTGTYAKEGAIAGGLLGAISGGFFAELACGLSEDANKSCAGSFLIGGAIGAAMGALPGALVGGLFPKYPKNTKVVQPES